MSMHSLVHIVTILFFSALGGVVGFGLVARGASSDPLGTIVGLLLGVVAGEVVALVSHGESEARVRRATYAPDDDMEDVPSPPPVPDQRPVPDSERQSQTVLTRETPEIHPASGNADAVLAELFGDNGNTVEMPRTSSERAVPSEQHAPPAEPSAPSSPPVRGETQEEAKYWLNEFLRDQQRVPRTLHRPKKVSAWDDMLSGKNGIDFRNEHYQPPDPLQDT